MYEIFKAKNEFLDDRFLWHWLKSDIFNRIVVNNQEGGVRTCFNLLKFFEACITIPKSVKEQRLIGELFDIIDQSITLHQRDCFFKAPKETSSLNQHLYFLVPELYEDMFFQSYSYLNDLIFLRRLQLTHQRTKVKMRVYV